MYLRVTTTPNSPRKSVKVVESIREGFKVKQKILLHVGVATNEDEIEKLKQIGQEFIAEEQVRREKISEQGNLFDQENAKERLEVIKHNFSKRKLGRKPLTTLQAVTAEDKISLADLVEEKRIIEGIHDITGNVYSKMGYDALLTRKKDVALLKDIVLMRLANPSSKLKTQEILDKQFSKKYDIDLIYRLMDKLTLKISDIKKITFEKTKNLMPDSIDIIFFDCTTLYFESVTTDELRDFGYSKDHRFNTTQVVLALAQTAMDYPLVMNYLKVIKQK